MRWPAAHAQNHRPALQRITSRRHALAAEAGALRPNKAVSERGSAADLAALDVGSGSGGDWEHRGPQGGRDSMFMLLEWHAKMDVHVQRSCPAPSENAAQDLSAAVI